eukprot:scaffold314730_cov24-Tisochrysis_lutea.AAC.1
MNPYMCIQRELANLAHVPCRNTHGGWTRNLYTHGVMSSALNQPLHAKERLMQANDQRTHGLV